MLKNYFLIAWRNIVRNKVYSAINITGLAIGISACLVIFLIVRYEFSFDRFHAGGDRIYRVYSEFSGDFHGFNHGVPTAMAASAKTELTGCEAMAGFHTFSAPVSYTMNGGKKEFERQRDIAIVSPDYFSVFEAYQWLAGSPSSSLTKPYQVVLTEGKAKKYFGTTEVQTIIGRDLVYRDSLVLTVSGIVKDLPGNSILHFNDFISLSTIESSWLRNNFSVSDWQSTNSSSQFFIRLSGSTPVKKMESGLRRLSQIYTEKHKDANWSATYHIQSLRDIHFNTDTGVFDGATSAAHLPTLKLLIVVALLLLIIATINFVNLETAQSVRRAREVGIRKVMGSSRSRLITHFLIQSVLFTSLAVIISLPLALGGIQFFQGFIPSAVQLTLSDPFVILFLIATLISVSLLAGIYPAIAMSSFQPALALKNQLSITSKSTRSSVVRKALIVFQFTFAQGLIIATIVVGGQISYLLNSDIGFTREAVIWFNAPWQRPQERVVTLKNQIERIPEASAVTLCADVPASGSYNSDSFNYSDGKTELHHNVYRKYGDTAFISVFNMHLLAGRNIHRSDTARELIINETYRKSLGFKNPEDAISKILTNGKSSYPIVGVVKDFNFLELHKAIEPMVIADAEKTFYTIAVKYDPATGAAGIKKLTDQLRVAWKNAYPDDKLEYFFLDESVAKLYAAEQRTSRLVNTATVVAILISCLGLFGLASFTVVQRSKEIGIRKVLGASVQGIVLLLSKQFLILVFIAFVISAPFSWYGANQWLAQYAYHITPGWLIFLVTILGSVVIVLLTVSYQAIKAALTDPVESLRYE